MSMNAGTIEQELPYGGGGIVQPNPDPRNYEWSKLGLGSRLTPNDHSAVPEFNIMNQGVSSACGGYAAAYYKYAIEHRQINNTRNFSPYATYGYRVEDAYEGEGMYTKDICKGLQKNGVPFFQPSDNGEYTYEEAKQLATKPRPEYAEEALLFANESYYYCNTWTEIMQAIKETGGCLILVPIYLNMYGTDPYINQYEGEFTGIYHFLCAVDYSDDFKYVKCVNGWGDYNDTHGYVYLSTELEFEEAVAFVDTTVEEELKAFDFTDIDETRWSYDYVQTCARSHIMEGFDDKSFQPE